MTYYKWVIPCNITDVRLTAFYKKSELAVQKLIEISSKTSAKCKYCEIFKTYLQNINKAKQKYCNIHDTSSPAKHNCYQVRTINIILFSLFSEQFTIDCLCQKKAPYFALKTNTIHNSVTCRIQLAKVIAKYISRSTSRREQLRNNIDLLDLQLNNGLNTLEITQIFLKAWC